MVKIFFKCLFLHICWGFFFFSLRERMYSWRCVTHSRRTKQAQLRAHLLSPGSHVQWQGRDGCVGGSGTCVLPADAASFGSEPPSCHWELGSVSGPSRWFWGDRTACVVMGSLKRLTSTEQKHRLRLTEPTQSWQTDTPPKGRPEFSSRDTTLTNRGDSF